MTISLPPGKYDLVYVSTRNDLEVASPIKEAIIMPEDGSDMDLGVLPMGNLGNLELIVEGERPPAGSIHFILRWKHYPGFYGHVGRTTLEEWQDQVIFEGIRPGPVWLSTHISKPWLLDPHKDRVEIVADETTTLRFNSRPTTHFKVTIPEETWPNRRFKKFELHGNGQNHSWAENYGAETWVMENPPPPKPLPGNEPHLKGGPDKITIKHMPPGIYDIEATLHDGTQLSRQIEIILGISQELDLLDEEK